MFVKHYAPLATKKKPFDFETGTDEGQGQQQRLSLIVLIKTYLHVKYERININSYYFHKRPKCCIATTKQNIDADELSDDITIL